jgi:hypothetical protein
MQHSSEQRITIMYVSDCKVNEIQMKNEPMNQLNSELTKPSSTKDTAD